TRAGPITCRRRSSATPRWASTRAISWRRRVRPVCATTTTPRAAPPTSDRNEGWADYMSSSFIGNSAVGEYASDQLAPAGETGLRDNDNTKGCPTDIRSERGLGRLHVVVVHRQLRGGRVRERSVGAGG